MALYFDGQTTLDSEQYDAIAYYRLSKDDGAKRESDSIANQRKLIRSFLQNNPNIHLIEEAQDDGYTGTNFDRPGFRSVLNAIQSKRVNCVIVKDLSRLGREYIETGKYLEMIFPSFGVRFIAINDDVDSENSRAGDDIIIPVKNIMNEAYCRELSKKLRKQFQIQRGNGEFLGAFANYGYCKSPNDKHKLVVDDYAAEVVRGIFSLKFQGYNQQAIADFLNNEKVLSPADYKKSQGLKYKTGFRTSSESHWSAVSVSRILTNPIYTGKLVQGKRGTPNYKIKTMRMREEKDWVVVENNHDPIIDPLTFMLVQRMLERDTRTAPQNDIVYPLSGMVFCADCKASMLRRTVRRGNKTFRYYVCSANKRGNGCSSHSFEQSKLEQTVLRAITKQIDIILDTDELLNAMGKSKIENAHIRRLDLAIVQKNSELDRYCNFRMKLYEALNDDLIDRDEYEKMRNKYTGMIEETENIIRQLSADREKSLTNTTPRDWMASIAKFKGITALSREAVITLVDRIYVYEDKHIRIDFNFRNELAYYKEILQQKEVG